MILPNPWLLVGAGAALVGAFFYGMHVEHGRFMAFQARVEAVSELAAARAAERKAQDERARKEADYAHQQNEKDLRIQLARLDERLRIATRPRRSVVPAAPETPASSPDDGRICFEREELRRRIDASLERFAGSLAGFAGRYGEIAGRGATALNDLNTCTSWAKSISPL